jgi:hypothetical protein
VVSRAVPGVVQQVVVDGRRYAFAQRPEHEAGMLTVRAGGNDYLITPYPRVLYQVTLMVRPPRRRPDDPPHLIPLDAWEDLPDLEAVARFIDMIK